jgi:hypothetical protein
MGVQRKEVKLKKVAKLRDLYTFKQKKWLGNKWEPNFHEQTMSETYKDTSVFFHNVRIY